MGLISTTAPAGSVQAFAGATAPDGWLLCDGTAISRTTFATLYGAIGVAHGAGDGSTTFNLPDHRGRFLRGYTTDTSRDPDLASRTNMKTGATYTGVGSIQADQYATHNHSPTVIQTGGSEQAQTGSGAIGMVSAGPIGYSGGNETRPKNAYVNYIIKY